MTRCTATSKSGRPCSNRAQPGAELCVMHLAAAGDPAALAEQRRRLQGKREPRDTFAGYRDDPVGFTRSVLGWQPWARQADFMRAVAQHDRVALKSGHKTGKTAALAALLLWFVLTRPRSRAFFTNSSERQVGVVNYRALKHQHKHALLPLGGHVHDTAGRGIVWPDERHVMGFATNETDNLGGLSGDHLMFVVDEASGVPRELIEAIEGNAAGDNAVIVLAGNPLRPADHFYDTFASRASTWHTMTISSLESPNIVEGREVVRGLASPRFVERARDNYGVGSPFWQSRVLGEFPSQSEYSVIALADVLAAAQRGATAAFADLSQRLVVGLDVGRFGDDESVATCVRGAVVVGMHVFRGLDGPSLAAKVVEAALRYRQGEERVQVNVDVIGVGSSPFDALNSGAYGWVDAVAVNVAESPTVDDHYARLRDQLWFELARWLKTGAIPRDEKLIGELTAPNYSFNVQGNRKVESKDEIKKKLKRSPDRADSLALAVFSGSEPSTAELWLRASRMGRLTGSDILDM